MIRLEAHKSIVWVVTAVLLSLLSLSGCASSRQMVAGLVGLDSASRNAPEPYQNQSVELVAFEGPTGDNGIALLQAGGGDVDEKKLGQALESKREDGALTDDSEVLPDPEQVDRDLDDEKDASDDSEGTNVDDTDDTEADEEDIDPEQLPTPQSRIQRRECSNGYQLGLDQVLASVATSYPLLEVAMNELAAADGKALASWGSFDTVLSAYTFNQPLGFYETYRHGAKAVRPLWNGGEVYAGYRIGRGVFEPWYEERQTNEGGEFKTGFKLPLLKNRAIDGRRTAVQVANLQRFWLEPDIRARVIELQRAASQLYWKWVAAGQVVRTQDYLLELAKARNENLVKRVEEGDLPRITEIDNGRFIAKRQAKLIESRRKVQQAAIKLSLFLRDESGQPIVPQDELLPCSFPKAIRADSTAIEYDIAQAIAQRPELLGYDFERQQVETELAYAQNQTLPKFDAYAEAGQDVGEPTSSTRDKSELEIELGLLAEVPLQRRSALGKIQAAEAKLAQIAAKRRFAEDKIRSQVQDAVSALDNAYERIEQARENLRLTEQSLRLGRLRFEEGDIDILQLNIYETSLAEAELLLIEAEFTYFGSMAEYRAALATDLQIQ